MLFLIQFIQNAVNIYSLILIIFALLSWFPSAYESSFGRLIVSLVKPILIPLQRLPLQFAGLDLTVWIAVLLVRFLGNQLIRLLLIFL